MLQKISKRRLYCFPADAHIGQTPPHTFEVPALRKGEQLIEIIVHYPETPEKQALFDARVAKFHAEYVIQRIEKLSCSTEQKLKLIDAIAQTILDGYEKDKQK